MRARAARRALVDDGALPTPAPARSLVSRHLTRITSNTAWSTMADLTEIRIRIRRDRRPRICDLFAQRQLQCTHEVAEYERESGKPILDRGRERAQLADVATKVPEKLQGLLSRSSSASSWRSPVSERSAETQPAESELRRRTSRTAIGGTPALFPQDAFVACQGSRGASPAACGRPPVRA